MGRNFAIEVDLGTRCCIGCRSSSSRNRSSSSSSSGSSSSNSSRVWWEILVYVERLSSQDSFINKSHIFPPSYCLKDSSSTSSSSSEDSMLAIRGYQKPVKIVVVVKILF